MKIPGSSVGIHHFPPAAELRLVLSDGEPVEEVDDTARIGPMIPDHLPLRFEPEPLPPYLRPRKMTLRDLDLALDEEDKERPSTIFAPDDRMTFMPTAFPFTAIGRVMTAGSRVGSGVMVGPRHMLTASHVIDQDAPLALTFTPALFGPSAPFGTVSAIAVFARRRVRGGIGPADGKQDYAVVVLSATIGFNTGFLGARNYDPRRFDGRSVWNHVRYPADLGSTVPTFHRVEYPLRRLVDGQGVDGGCAIEGMFSQDSLAAHSSLFSRTDLFAQRSKVVKPSGIIGLPPAAG